LEVAGLASRGARVLARLPQTERQAFAPSGRPSLEVVKEPRHPLRLPMSPPVVPLQSTFVGGLAPDGTERHQIPLARLGPSGASAPGEGVGDRAGRVRGRGRGDPLVPGPAGRRLGPSRQRWCGSGDVDGRSEPTRAATHRSLLSVLLKEVSAGGHADTAGTGRRAEARGAVT